MTANFLGIKNSKKLPEYQKAWIDSVLKNNGQNKRDKKWTESIAVGDIAFVLATKAKLGVKGIENDIGFELKEPQEPYMPVFDPGKGPLSPNNAYLWDVSL
jgi:hypothetical protein